LGSIGLVRFRWKPNLPLPSLPHRRRGRPSRRCSPGVGAAVVAAGGSCVPRPSAPAGGQDPRPHHAALPRQPGQARHPGGPLELKNTKGRTPVLDIGALHRIRSGDIEVVPRIKRFVQQLLLDLISGFKDTILYFLGNGNCYMLSSSMH